MPAAKKPSPASSSGPLVTNRKARRNYEILENLEAGLRLQGTEVKSIRAGQASLDESYVQIHQREAWLHGMHVATYEQGNKQNHEPLRARKLLLHKKEIDRLHGQVSIKGRTIVPLKLYLKRGRVKVELGVGKGKQMADKREDIKRRTADRDSERAIAAHRRR